MATAKNNYINVELEFAEKQLKQFEQYMEDNPINEIKDRWGSKEMPKGGQAWVVTASAEAQIKCVQDTLVRYLQLVEVIKRLRQNEEAQIEARGSQEVNGKMKNDLLKR